MGRRHARALLALDERAELGGVYDPDPTAAASSLPTYASEAEAIADADVVFIATPIAAHVGTVLRALDAGRDVFVEKPIGATGAESTAMVDAATRTGRRLFVGHSERFNPVVRALRRAVDPESIRSVTFCRVGAPRAGIVKIEPPRARTRDVLLNLGVHDFDLAAYITDSRALARAAFGREDAADILLSTARGPARVRVGREGERERRILVTTADAIYRGDLLRFRLTVNRHAFGPSEASEASGRGRDRGTDQELALETEEPLIAQARAVFDALDGRASEIAEGLDGARAVRLAEKSLALLRRPASSPALAESPASHYVDSAE